MNWLINLRLSFSPSVRDYPMEMIMLIDCHQFWMESVIQTNQGQNVKMRPKYVTLTGLTLSRYRNIAISRYPNMTIWRYQTISNDASRNDVLQLLKSLEIFENEDCRWFLEELTVAVSVFTTLIDLDISW